MSEQHRAAPRLSVDDKPAHAADSTFGLANQNDASGGETGTSVVPVPGALTADLASDTDDPSILQQRLARARGRLAFYESFDRVIQENIRRSGELMLEAIALREQTQAEASAAEQVRTALERRLIEQRDQHTRLLGDLQGEIICAHASLSELDERVRAALRALSDQSDAASETATIAEQPLSAEASAEVPPVERATMRIEAGGTPTAADTGVASTAASDTSDASDAAPTPPEEASLIVEVLAHGVPRAAVALSLQRHLGTLSHVLAVEAREFAEGILRLQVTTIRPLEPDDLADWQDGASAIVQRVDPAVLELALPHSEDV